MKKELQMEAEPKMFMVERVADAIRLEADRRGVEGLGASDAIMIACAAIRAMRELKTEDFSQRVVNEWQLIIDEILEGVR
jgi:hypothetical protein